MRKILIFIFWTLLFTNNYGQDSTYYWAKGQKHYLKLGSMKEFILTEGLVGKIELETGLQNLGIDSIIKIKETIYPRNAYNAKQIQYNWAILKKSTIDALDFKTKVNILYNAPYFISKEGHEFGISHLFYVKLKSADDFDILKQYAADSNVKIIEQDEQLPLWYTLECSKETDGNSLNLANRFYESGLFESAQPNFIEAAYSTGVSPDDTYFSYQWGLYNYGQHQGTAGVDINAIDAWQISHGDKSITIAVFDVGVQQSHPDLSSFSTYSYDTYTRSSPNTTFDDHGTCVAGIIAAEVNNDMGTAGIAPNTLIMDIRNSFGYDSDTDDEKDIKAGFIYASDNGADIINCSWVFATFSEIINEGIEYAIENGRGGLGCVVVFGTGNADAAVQYPVKSNADAIAVGSINQIGNRITRAAGVDTETQLGSNYGDEIDFAAPGFLIPTTDIVGTSGYNPSSPSYHEAHGGTIMNDDASENNYTLQFNGTSSSAPHVSGTAGLVLSVNNGLTYSEVTDILASSAQKVGTNYTYTTTTERPNYTWNENVGYGLVDAGEAVNEAVCEHLIESTTYTSDITIDGCTSVDMEDISVEDDAILTIENVGSITIDGPFEAEVGTQLVFDP